MTHVPSSVSVVELHLRSVTIGQVAALVATGEIDLATAPQLRSALMRLVTDAPGQLVAVDLDGVDALDDTGLGLLLGAAARARGALGDLAVVCSPGRLRDRLALTRLDRAVTVVSSLGELAALRSPR